ncbi:ROK family protein [Paenibacillus sp. LC-T2]|uniref:ROK family protein n=2 Tax=Paenibacillus monticola TaxID=2666075 RepID=A0A7X2KZY1_9BACL|nr:ROK family protein [Paenibacillus monticola]MRN52192.1 ROK family protein [Paenibacillus monticola]
MSKPSLAASTTKKAIYERIARQRDVPKAELMDEFRMTSSSLTRLLEEMTDEGWIVEAGLGQSTGGRKPILYQINPTQKVIFGLEISRLYSALGLFDLEMNTLSFCRWTMDGAMTPERLVNYISSSMDTMLAEHHLDKSKVAGIGVGAVGPLDRHKGYILNPLYFPAAGWSDVPICELLENTTGIRAILENGANTALIGEHWVLRNDNIQHMLYVHAGTGLRSAMMSNGNLVHGAVDMEGSIGQMIIQTDGPRLHNMGNYGALEAFASVQALEKQVRAQRNMRRDRLTSTEGLESDVVHFDMLVEALNQGDPFIHEIFTQSASYMGIGLANLINILHPETVILGGALINAHRIYYDTAISVAQKNIYYFPEYQPTFSKGILQENAVSMGAAVMVFKQLQI